MKKISLLLFLMSTMFTFSQSEFQVEVDLGYAFQTDMMLNNENLEPANAFGIRLGVNYLKTLNEKLYLETGLYGKYNRANREIETLEFTSNSLKIQLPLYLGYKIDDTWRLNVGASIENNKDFDEIDFKREDNLRYDLLTKLIYVYNQKLQFSFYTNWMLNSTPDVYTVSSPRNGMYLGVIYKLGKVTKTKKD
ncbi:outer membrane beta-barrel protein [Pontimicrobium sp. IMCC45349]|uniref:outer membrane beta-barrel protein n=1 Tax=Pontimicrobium sp. IMCC45349 TaxID=3391574 RepID=UPI0039A039EB